MSNEPRIPDQIISVRTPRVKRVIQHDLFPEMKVEMFGAYQFKDKHNRMDRNFRPTVPIGFEERKEWYNSMFRLRINGKWHVPGKTKYVFFSKEEVGRLLVDGL